MMQPEGEAPRRSWTRSALERLAQTLLGKIILNQLDNFLRILEKTIEWSLPQIEGSSNERTQEGSIRPNQLERPLPWVLFIPSLILLRVIRINISIVTYLCGWPTVTPLHLLQFVKRLRANLLALKGPSASSRIEPATEENRLSINEAKKALIRSIRLTLSTLSCMDGSKPSLSPPPTRIHISALDLDDAPEQTSSDDANSGPDANVIASESETNEDTREADAASTATIADETSDSAAVPPPNEMVTVPSDSPASLRVGDDDDPMLERPSVVRFKDQNYYRLTDANIEEEEEEEEESRYEHPIKQEQVTVQEQVAEPEQVAEQEQMERWEEVTSFQSGDDIASDDLHTVITPHELDEVANHLDQMIEEMLNPVESKAEKTSEHEQVRTEQKSESATEEVQIHEQKADTEQQRVSESSKQATQVQRVPEQTQSSKKDKKKSKSEQKQEAKQAKAAELKQDAKQKEKLVEQKQDSKREKIAERKRDTEHEKKFTEQKRDNKQESVTGEQRIIEQDKEIEQKRDAEQKQDRNDNIQPAASTEQKESEPTEGDQKTLKADEQQRDDQKSDVDRQDEKQHQGAKKKQKAKEKQGQDAAVEEKLLSKKKAESKALHKDIEKKRSQIMSSEAFSEIKALPFGSMSTDLLQSFSPSSSYRSARSTSPSLLSEITHTPSFDTSLSSLLPISIQHSQTRTEASEASERGNGEVHFVSGSQTMPGRKFRVTGNGAAVRRCRSASKYHRRGGRRGSHGSRKKK